MNKTLLALAALTAGTLSSQAATTLIDFSDATATSGADSNGNFWTTIGSNPGTADVTVNDLIDTTNTATTWDIAVTSTGAGFGYGGNGIGGAAGSNPFDQTFATTDGAFINDATSTMVVTLSGLMAGETYTFGAIGGRAAAGQDGIITVTTGTGTAGILANAGTQLDFTVVADGSGAIALTFAENGPDVGSSTWNALSVTSPVPEPSSTALLGLGGLALILRRRK